MLKNLLRDAFCYHQISFPEKTPNFFSWLWIFLSSRGLLTITLHRLNQWKFESKITKGIMPIVKIALRITQYFQQILTKSYIRPSTILGTGVYLSNLGHIILGAKMVGAGTVINNCVTIGMDLERGEVPTIGRNVWVGPYSVIYGNIHVGDGATIMPHTVLTKSIPAGSVVQGNPARIVIHNFDNSTLRSTPNTNIDLHKLKIIKI